MDRRGFIKGCAAAVTAVALSKTGFARQAATPSEVIPVSLQIDPRRHGARIGQDFLGLSYEAGAMGDPEFFSASNHTLLGFLRTLTPSGVLRIGGNSSDGAIWDPDGTQSLTPWAGTGRRPAIITRAAVDNLGEFLRASGWSLIYGLNLGSGILADDVSQAQAVQASARHSLTTFQIGNEPDLFHRNGHRPSSYAYSDYRKEFETYTAAVRAALPHAKFAGPDVSSNLSWVKSLAQDDAHMLTLLTSHYYAEGPPDSPNSTIEHLLTSNTRFAQVIQNARDIAQSAKLPCRLAEANSCYSGGKPGVSDVFASALWGVDLLYTLAQAGSMGINFHGGGTGPYTPIAADKQGNYSARPLYYGMLLFAQGSRGTLLETTLNASSVNLAAYAVAGEHGQTFVTLINKDMTQPATVSVDAGHSVKSNTVMRLAAPAIDSTMGVTLGGASVDSHGSWVPTVKETAPMQGTTVTVSVPAGSAALLTFKS